MLRSGYLNFFDILNSGIYKFGDDTSPLGINTEEALDGVKEWVDGQKFPNTSPWSPLAKDNRSIPPVRCYCKEIYKTESNDFIVVLWKHDPSDIGGYMGLKINSDGIPGGVLKNNSSSKKANDKVIWGHPCYYWVIPEINSLVSIKFDDSTCDTQLFHKWLTHCVKFKADFPGFKSKENVDGKTSIRFSVPGKEGKNFTYKFEAKTIQIKTDIEKLKSACKGTTSIILRESIATNSSPLKNISNSTDESLTSADEGSDVLIELFRKMFASRKTSDSNVRKFEMSIEANPTYEEIEALIEATAHHGEDSWSDVFFVNKNERVSLKSYRINESISISRIENIYTAKQLEKVLAPKRGHILQTLKKTRALPIEKTVVGNEAALVEEEETILMVEDDKVLLEDEEVV